MKVISGATGPIFNWCEDLDQDTLDQILNMRGLPFTKHVAVMPDAHMGYGMCIGGVLGTIGAVIPNAVGVDIGCGMVSTKTSIKNIPIGILQTMVEDIKNAIPVGFSRNEIGSPIPEANTPVVLSNYESAKKQVGTLGGGNHFIEIQTGSDGSVWIMIHSGSRNLGKQVADFYNALATKLNAKWYSAVGKEVQLAFLPIDTAEYKNYMKEMQYCVEFAKLNRAIMISKVQSIVSDYYPEANFTGILDVAHNYAQWEHHNGTNMIVHRKGATKVTEGSYGIIPGSMGTASYIVKGLGNEKSLDSCSHGAGRAMGRKQAQRELNLQDTIDDLNSKNILHGISSTEHLEEAPAAYKDIDAVMANQSDLVTIVEKLVPIAVVKG